MHIELDKEDYTFTTLSGPLGSHRALIVRIAGKPLFTTRSVETYLEKIDPRYAEFIDNALIESIARILTKILEKSCLDAPEGVEIIDAEEDRRITAKVHDTLYPWNVHQKESTDAQRMQDLIRTTTAPQRFMGIDQGVPGADRTVYYRKNTDGTYTELDGNIDLGQNSSVDESAVQSGHYPTYGGQVRGEGPQMKEPNYYGPPSSKGKHNAD